MSTNLDELDRKILIQLQEDASQSLDEIARKVNSSKTPVWNRIRKMREEGIIGAQTVILDAEEGMKFEPYNVITLDLLKKRAELIRTNEKFSQNIFFR